MVSNFVFRKTRRKKKYEITKTKIFAATLVATVVACAQHWPSAFYAFGAPGADQVLNAYCSYVAPA